MSEKRKIVMNKIEQMRDEIIEFTKNLIKIPTYNPPGNDYPRMADFLTKTLSDLELKVKVIEVPREKLDELAPQGEGLPRPNVFAVLEGKMGKPVLHYNAHYDVVPAGAWTSAFEPKVEDGKLYGRGSSDMKSGLASIIMAVKALKECGVELKGNLSISATPDEETGGQTGLGFLVHEGYLKNTSFALIPEPSGVDGFSPAEKGDIWLEITIKGKAAHGSVPFKGINAFIKGAKLASIMEKELNSLFKKKGPSKFPVKPTRMRYATICIGGVAKGGTKTNIVPDEFMFTVDRRVIPEETLEEAFNEIMDIINKMKKKDPELNVNVKKTVWVPPAQTPISSSICLSMEKVLKEILRKPPAKMLAPYFTDMHYLTNAGIHSIIYGPGRIEQAHAMNEFCLVNDIVTCTKALALLALDMLS